METYWQSLEDLEESKKPTAEIAKAEEAHNSEVMELLEGLPFKATASRRDFLKILTYSVGSAALLAACKRPVQNAIPFLVQPENIVPGTSKFYASTFFDGHEYCPVLVKVRDGRPIKIEGNNMYKYTRGGTSPRVQASVLSLYDNARIKGPSYKNKVTTWENADKEIIGSLQKMNASGREIVILSSTVFSPSTLQIIDDFKSVYPQARLVTYDGVSFSGMVDAYKSITGKAAIPYPRFFQADVIVSFGADFIGTWPLSTEFTRAYVSKRKVDKGNYNMSRHIQYESDMSLTGSNADERIQIKPSQEASVIANLYNLIASKTGAFQINASPVDESFKLGKIADELLWKKGKSIVLSGSNDPNVQKIVIAINQLLGNYGTTLDIERPILLKQGSDKDMFDLVDRMKAGKVGAIFFNDTNPCYDYYDVPAFREALKNVELKVSFSEYPNETLPYCDYVCPDHHFLESWNDFNPRTGVYSLSQPTIHHVFDTRQMQESLLVWANKPAQMDHYLQDFWRRNLLGKQTEITDADAFWHETLRNGILETNETDRLAIGNIDVKGISVGTPSSGTLEVKLVVPVAIPNGYHSNNPWLQELPDPISRVTWDNYASVSHKFAEETKLKTGDIIRIADKIDIPVVVQPGQAYGTMAIGLNYGRTHAGKVAEDVGVNAYPLLQRQVSNLQYFLTDVSIAALGRTMEMAQTQTHHTMEGRDIVRETTLSEYKANPAVGSEKNEDFDKRYATLYPNPQYTNFHWGLGVDLNSCIGCGACVIACQAENNVAVVGKEQVTKRRIMHWIRVDRYYTGPPEAPYVVYQPLMCQQCDNAPCENVCPVAATTHSNEGISQMAYNRCVGTRYCINNCPYKVRRFNWLKFADNPKFDYNQNSQLGKMVLNPDVVVRERGVVEKCSFCVQRIQERKLAAKLENREVKDGEVIPACVQACPADAMNFGDLNDKHSNVFKLFTNERNYYLLEELHTLPTVGYLTKVRNKEA
ncbi:MAG TPA: Fe-S-cluster-containing hydrogenase [Bacteroidales bacterium]|nr:Fe-S-cluster-containing hydrogenase [Bacteroidales bacterium]